MSSTRTGQRLVRTFRDPAGSNRVGLIAEVPDVASFQAARPTEEAAGATRHDGVLPETIVLLVEAHVQFLRTFERAAEAKATMGLFMGARFRRV